MRGQIGNGLGYVNAAVNKGIVSIYKVLGVILLVAILMGFGSYLFLTLFYFFDHRWITPLILSPTDERVIRLNDQMSQLFSLREKLAAERQDLVARLEDDHRIVETQRNYQANLKLAMEAALSDRSKELKKLQANQRTFDDVSGQVLKAGRSFSELSREQNQQLYRAHLIDQDELVTSNYQISQIANSTLSMAERGAVLDTQSHTLAREVDSLNSVTKALAPRTPRDLNELSYETLRVKNEFYTSIRESQKAEGDRKALAEIIQAMDANIARQDRMLQEIKDSPYIRAAEENLTVAFVPYDNRHAREGQPIFACEWRVILCREVGQVGETLAGEVVGKHPLRDSSELRGVLVRMKLKDPKWARQDVLHLGSKPLGIL